MKFETVMKTCRELMDEGYGFLGVRIYLNDLIRGKDIPASWSIPIMKNLIEENYDCSVATF